MKIGSKISMIGEVGLVLIKLNFLFLISVILTVREWLQLSILCKCALT